MLKDKKSALLGSPEGVPKNDAFDVFAIFTFWQAIGYFEVTLQ